MSKKHRTQPAPAGPPGDPYGHEALFAAATRCRAKWPSPQAREIRRQLEAAGHLVERQFRLGDSLYAADFYLPRFGVAVLLDGRLNGYRRSDALRRRQLLCRRLGIAAVTVGESAAASSALAEIAALLPAAPAALAA